MHFSIDRTVHTTAFDKPVVKRKERKKDRMKERKKEHYTKIKSLLFDNTDLDYYYYYYLFI